MPALRRPRALQHNVVLLKKARMKKILLIDGSNYLFRAYHALPPLTTSSGEPTGAIKGFLGMLARVMQMVKPDLAAVVFDAPGKTFRSDLYADYKANRPPMPEDLRLQIEPLKAVVADLGWPLLTVPGIEADDVIGTIALKADAAGMSVVIATGDKDLSQLVGERIVILNTMNNKVYDRGGVIEKYGVPPERIIDYLALMGDKVDNVPGISGCGPKTAAKWIEQFGSLDGVIANAESVAGKIGEKLRAGLSNLPLSRELVTIKTDACVPGFESFEDLSFRVPKLEALTRFGERWEMSSGSVLRALPGGKSALEAAQAAAAPAPEPAEASLFDETVPEPAAPQQGDLFEPQAESGDAALDLSAAALPVMPEETPDLIEPNPDEVPFVCAQSLEDLEALACSLEAFSAQSSAPAAVAVLYDGTARKPDFAGLAIALSPKDVHVVLTSETLSTAALSQALGPWFASSARKVFHDAKSAMHALAALKIETGGLVDDVMLQDYVLEAHLSHALEKLAARFARRRIPTPDEVLGKGAKRVPWQEADRSAIEGLLAEEAAAVRAAWAVLNDRLEGDPALSRVYETIERPLMRVLWRMERAGTLLNCRKLLEESKELEGRIAELEAQAHEAAGRPFNLGSPKQLGDILFNVLQIEVRKKTATGAPSTSEEVLEELALDYPLPKIILEWRRLTKLKSTYLDKLPRLADADGRIRTTFGQATAVTGRLASADPNLQNIPARTPEGRRIREAFEAKEGFLIVDADYSQIELRIMAHLSGDKGLLSAFARGEDVHRSTAAEVFGKALDQVTPDERRMAKVINFGLIYGMSAFGLAQQLGLDRKVAAAYVERYFARFPGVKRYMNETRAKALEWGCVETVFGRRLWLPDIKSTRHAVRAGAERAAINAPMQGTAADLIKLAMIAVDDWLVRSGLKSRLILQVHDELVVEAPVEEAEIVKKKLPELMAGVASLTVPLIAEVGVGPDWGAAH